MTPMFISMFNELLFKFVIIFVTIGVSGLILSIIVSLWEE